MYISFCTHSSWVTWTTKWFQTQDSVSPVPLTKTAVVVTTSMARNPTSKKSQQDWRNAGWIWTTTGSLYSRYKCFCLFVCVFVLFCFVFFLVSLRFQILQSVWLQVRGNVFLLIALSKHEPSNKMHQHPTTKTFYDRCCQLEIIHTGYSSMVVESLVTVVCDHVKCQQQQNHN